MSELLRTSAFDMFPDAKNEGNSEVVPRNHLSSRRSFIWGPGPPMPCPLYRSYLMQWWTLNAPTDVGLTQPFCRTREFWQDRTKYVVEKIMLNSRLYSPPSIPGTGSVTIFLRYELNTQQIIFANSARIWRGYRTHT